MEPKVHLGTLGHLKACISWGSPSVLEAWIEALVLEFDLDEWYYLTETSQKMKIPVGKNKTSTIFEPNLKKALFHSDVPESWLEIAFQVELERAVLSPFLQSLLRSTIMSSYEVGLQKNENGAVRKHRKIPKSKTQNGHHHVVTDQGGSGCSQEQARVMGWGRSGSRKQKLKSKSPLLKKMDYNFFNTITK